MRSQYRNSLLFRLVNFCKWYSHVNAMLAGGGNVKIKNYPRGVTMTAPRVDVRDNMKHTPGGGNVKVGTPI